MSKFRVFDKFIVQNKLIKPYDSLLVGVSGGPDSVCLLRLLCDVKEKLHLTVHVCHVDHGIRNDSAVDSLIVKRLCDEWNVCCTVVKLKRKANNQCMSEEDARNARFSCFEKVSKRFNTNKLCLAHTFDDQAETVLMRLIRGCGLQGLSSMKDVSRFRNLIVVRPLLNFRKSAILAFLKKRNINFAVDSTNASQVFLRNKIRLQLLPLLEKEYNSNIYKTLCALAETASLDYDYLKRAALEIKMKKGSSISLKKIKIFHPALQRLLLRRLIEYVQGDTRSITFRHILELEDLISMRPVGSIVHLPSGLFVQKDKSLLRIYHSRK